MSQAFLREKWSLGPFARRLILQGLALGLWYYWPHIPRNTFAHYVTAARSALIALLPTQY